MSGPRTLYQKIWNDHVIASRDDGTALVWIDRHLVHEVTSPQAFQRLRDEGRCVRRPDLTLAVPDHNVPTTSRLLGASDAESQQQVDLLESNCRRSGIPFIATSSPDHGIVHVIGPELGFTLPGLTIVCGDSHTATHGAFGSIGMGIGASEVEHVLATQTLWLPPSQTMEVRISGALGTGVTAKDLALAIVGRLGASGGTGYTIEFTGEAIRALSMEGRMTLCNMAIEAGARTGLVAPDDLTFGYLRGRPMAPREDHWEATVEYWRSLRSDEGAVYDKLIELEAPEVQPMVTWGTSPDQVAPIGGIVPDPQDQDSESQRESDRRALDYMGLCPGLPLQEIEIQNVFIGSCTNSRIEDLRAAAEVLRGRKVAATIRQALAVPGSMAVRAAAEAEGLHHIFMEAGFEWRNSGCSMCLGMNPDKVPPGERCASTSNRNFVGRQGPGARTHLMSPAMAAAAAVAGRLQDVRQLDLLP